jgi:hypothetical protein
MFGRPKGGEGGGSRPSIQDGHERLSSPLKIKRETEKAVGVENAQVISARATAKYDVKELSGSQIELLRSGAGDISWLPKSQISVHNGEVHGMAGWLAQKHGFRTEEGAAKREKAFEAGKKRYSELLKQAKDAGVKGVREGMRTATIKQKMMDAGVPVSFSEDDEGLDIMCGNFEFGQP